MRVVNHVQYGVQLDFISQEWCFSPEDGSRDGFQNVVFKISTDDGQGPRKED